MFSGDCLEIGQWRTSCVDICPVTFTGKVITIFLPSSSTLFQIHKCNLMVDVKITEIHFNQITFECITGVYF